MNDLEDLKIKTSAGGVLRKEGNLIISESARRKDTYAIERLKELKSKSTLTSEVI